MRLSRMVMNDVTRVSALFDRRVMMHDMMMRLFGGRRDLI